MSILSWFTEKLGRCPRCMGLSLGLALTAWAGTGIVLVASLPFLVAVLCAATAAAFTALFFAHIAAFTARAMRSEVTPCSHCGGKPDAQERAITRRHLIGIAGQALVAAAVLSLSNIPGARRVFAQDPLPCEDIGGPLEVLPKICVTQTDTEEQVKKRLEEQAQKWIADNAGTFEATARGNCRDRACKGDARCAAVHYRVSYQVRCRDDRTCESGRSCEAVVSMGVDCRCLPRECSTTKFKTPIEISSEICLDKENPTKKELEEACKQACQQVEALVQAAAARACEQEPCPPVGGTRPPCKPNKIHQSKPEVGRVKERPNCCRCTVVLSGVQCKCGD